MEAADAKGELAAILEPDGANKNPYAAHLRLTDNDIVNMEPKKKRKKRAKGSTGDGELFWRLQSSPTRTLVQKVIPRFS